MFARTSTKNAIRNLICASVFNGNGRIVVASTGRAGSTMVFNSVARSLIRHRFRLDPDRGVGRNLWRVCAGFAPRLADLNTPYPLVAKTHDLYEDPPADKDTRFIFVHGDPLESALSVRRRVDQFGESWFRQHQLHLRAEGDLSNIFQEDVLNYEAQMRSWLLCDDPRVFCVELDALWDYQDALSSHIGFTLELEPRRTRSEKSEAVSVNHALFERLRALSEELSSKKG